MLTLTLPRAVAAFIEPKPSRCLAGETMVDPSRARVLERIITINPTATAAFLERFGTPDLENYLGHLESSHKPRGADARWVRPDGVPGIVVRETRG